MRCVTTYSTVDVAHITDIMPIAYTINAKSSSAVASPLTVQLPSSYRICPMSEFIASVNGKEFRKKIPRTTFSVHLCHHLPEQLTNVIVNPYLLQYIQQSANTWMTTTFTIQH